MSIHSLNSLTLNTIIPSSDDILSPTEMAALDELDFIATGEILSPPGVQSLTNDQIASLNQNDQHQNPESNNTLSPTEIVTIGPMAPPVPPSGNTLSPLAVEKSSSHVQALINDQNFIASLNQSYQHQNREKASKTDNPTMEMMRQNLSKLRQMNEDVENSNNKLNFKRLGKFVIDTTGHFGFLTQHASAREIQAFIHNDAEEEEFDKSKSKAASQMLISHLYYFEQVTKHIQHIRKDIESFVNQARQNQTLSDLERTVADDLDDFAAAQLESLINLHDLAPFFSPVLTRGSG